MSTQYFSGIQVTTDSFGTPVSVSASTMAWTTSTYFRFRYTLDDPQQDEFSSITVELSSPSKLHASTVNGIRVYLDDAAVIGRIGWGTSAATVMIVQTGLQQFSIFNLAGDTLPTFATAEDYANFMASLTSLTSVLPTGLSQFGHSTLQNVAKSPSYVATSEDDLLVGVDGVDLWTLVPLDTFDGNDTVYGTSATDWVRGGDGNDLLSGMDGGDRLYGEFGNDSLYGDLGNDSLYGGYGRDYIEGGDGDDSVSGGDYNDTIFGGNGADRLNGEVGHDRLFGGLDNDTIYGGSGHDEMEGEAGDDVMRGDNGQDVMFGGDGADSMDGGKNEDLMYGGNGNDTMNGGSFNDTIYGDSGADLIKGGSGADQVFGGSGNDKILGDTGNDSIFGGTGLDTIEGGVGDDYIDGGDNNDWMRGGYGNDTIMSGLGDDTMIGLTGADSFVIESVTGNDLITDFRGDYGDLLYIHADLAADVTAAMDLATQDGTSVVFDFGLAGSLTLAKSTLEHVEQYLQIWSEEVPYL